MFDFRIKNPQYFLVYANIINNAVIAHIHQRLGNVRMDAGYASYECMCDLAWKNPVYAKELHTRFLEDVESGTSERIDKWHFRSWLLYAYERVSINSISWLGSTFAEFDGNVGLDEELWLSTQKPSWMHMPNIIYGDAICVHFAFYTQRGLLDATNVLQRYGALAAAKGDTMLRTTDAICDATASP